ncbi:DUF7344 domain-containing protein [Natranaeroarchaeum aerophilus]|uniref:DUF7344 domain-containing protein n=1 Tax=Natranaeroarchaeum aerophilus TaxID=2917711 RepID=A0AAE3FTV5_9EURY|nr:hypothetical protein [Natranaeroarchaeum aerophilus]MCL9815025.1 hypothetical protein [Natranaeroarchaeum aerophilus]
MGTHGRPASTERRSLTSGSGKRTSEIIRLLAPRRRQRLVAILEKRPATIDRHVVARTLVTEESDTNVPGSAAVQRVEIDLHHNHLPALDEAGVVQYDPERGTVQLRDTSQVKRVLAMVDRQRGYSSGL